ncbi:MAG: FAD-dependent oxidoreductase [Planctomycetes bacterium]|nr:FAD-dependent oxidoreductase [Planctomycetota bacterium]
MSMISVTIDGQQATVEPGTTVLAAARQIGIDIPTLCHVDGLEPVASCFLCAVQLTGRPNLSPACALPVSHGMVVTTDSPDIRAARKMALELLLSDHAGDCVAPCRARCPAGLDIPGFIYELATNRARRAAEIVTDQLVLPGALGRVCPRLCEQDCRRCEHDEGLAIAALHRHAADYDHTGNDPYLPDHLPASGKTVAIIGAGPAGLAAAYHLLRSGHACTLFDAHTQPGGMLRYGIPAYRLPRDALDVEVECVRRLGAQFRQNVRWGVDFTLADLRAQHDAVFVAIGAQLAQDLGCEGAAHALSGLEFLHRVASGDPPRIGDNVIVVGGGNTAMDAARTAIRLGAAHVRILYRRTRREMPCLLEEVEAAEAEGVRLDYLVAPTHIAPGAPATSDTPAAFNVTCQRMELGEPDSSGRRRPVPVAGSEFNLECDTVITAVGQAVDCAVAARDDLEVTRWGIRADARTLATSLPGVFAGGDAVAGADLAVRAVAAGRLAAVSISQYLAGQAVVGAAAPVNVLLRAPDDDERAALFRAIEQAPRVHSPRIDLRRRRTSFDEVEVGLGPDAALREARRCTTCGCRKADDCRVRSYATEYGVDPERFSGARRRFSQDLSHPAVVYEPGKCIMCDACVRIAAEAGEPLGVALVGRGFNVTMAVPFDEPLAAGLRLVAQRCAAACPTGALALRSQRSCDVGVCAGCPECGEPQ